MEPWLYANTQMQVG